METALNTTTRPPSSAARNRWQCDRKTWVITGLLTSVAIGWLSMQYVASYDERCAASAFEALGARVYYDFQWDEQDRPTEPVAPIWMLRWFSHVRAITGDTCAVTDSQLTHLNALPKLEILDLTRTRVSGAGFRNVHELRHLKGLYLAGTDCNDQGLAELARFVGLKHIILSQTPVSDVGIVHLEQLTNLQSLRLDGTRCSQQGLIRLRQKFPRCQIVL